MDVRPDALRRWVTALAVVVVLLALPGMAVYAATVGEIDTIPWTAPTRPETGPTPSPRPDTESGDMVEPAIVDDISAPPTATAAALPVTPVTLPTTSRQAAPQASNLIVNGSFEEGFVEGIGIGWGRFATASVQAGWQADTWSAVVFDGEHAQLLVLKDATEPDRYVGIFQSVTVAPDTDYTLTLRGLIRSDEGSIDASNYGYRLQYGIDYAGGGDWQSPDIQWVELPWDEQPRTAPSPGGYRQDTYATTIRSQGPRLTLFIRAWKKWIGAAEGNYDLDSVSLVLASAAPVTATPSPQPVVTSAPDASGTAPTPAPQMPQTGGAIPIVGNSALVAASVALVVLLVAGVLWNLSRRRA